MTHTGLPRRMTPLALLVTLFLAASADGCSGGSSTSGSEISAASSASSKSSSGGGEGGNASSSSGGGAGGEGGEPEPWFAGKVEEVASGAEFQSPFDATPDPSGEEIYFTAVDLALAPGVFRVTADGASKAKAVRVGAPFVAPNGIAMSTDGARLVIADPGWDTKSAIPGAIVSMAAGGGAPKEVSGTEGLAPQALDIIKEGGEDVVYFTGLGAAGPAVFKVNLAGGAAEEVWKGTAEIPVDTLNAISVAKDGSKIFVVNVDTIGRGRVIELKDGAASVFLDDLRIGNPGGVALRRDAVDILISTLDPVAKTSAVLWLNVNTKGLKPLTDVLGAYSAPAGLHRAYNTNVFAFVDNQAKGTGAIFVLR